MVDSAFSFNQSLLFAPSGLENGNSIGESALLLPDSELFNQNAPSQLSQPTFLETPALAESAPAEYTPGVKTARLFDGTTVKLRKRIRKIPTVSFNDSDSILDMDQLYERAKKRENIKQSKAALAQLPKKKLPNQPPQIWTDKYKPANFMDLCSAGNERQYRLILTYLRKWRSVLHGEPKLDDEFVDHLGRPNKKVLLVHGASGSGKTTIVHMLARQMGYVVQELNAANSLDTVAGTEADEKGRFAHAMAALKLKVYNALTSNTLDLTSAPGESTEPSVKPTCLVIDEIDSSINASDIVRVISDLVASDGRSKLSDDKKKNAKSKKPFVMRRPIICIANDIYTQNSRSYGPNPMDKLRPMCELVAFRRPVTSSSKHGRINVTAQKSVKDLLMKVNRVEKLGLDSKEISEVFETCEGDIRACLNYMQFTSRKLGPELVASSQGESSSRARKDESVSWFHMVDEIFRRDNRLSKDENFEVMLDMIVSSEGKYSSGDSLAKIIRGCFNRYLDVVHLQDDSVVRPAEISDWLYYYDVLNSSTRDGFLYPALTSLKFWSLFSDISQRKFHDDNSILPNAKSMEFESFELMKQNRAILKRLSDQMPVSLRLSFFGSSSNSEFYACQFVPFLDAMLSPAIGSSRLKVSLKPHEKCAVEKLAMLVKQLDIKLETTRDTETNQSFLSFAPNWDTITIFETDLTGQSFTAKAKALYSKRLWLFPILQSELDSATATNLLKRTKSATPTPEGEVAKVKRSRITSSVDYFKNQYDLISTQLETSSKPANSKMARIWVKYHEGFSNAVRKNIGWGDLWAP